MRKSETLTVTCVIPMAFSWGLDLVSLVLVCAVQRAHVIDLGIGIDGITTARAVGVLVEGGNRDSFLVHVRSPLESRSRTRLRVKARTCNQ